MSQSVLIIDDEEDLIKLLMIVLEKEGIKQVYSATTATEGMRVFKAVKPDLVLLDIMLPDGEGFDICKQMRQISQVPILFMSAKSEEIDKLLGLAIGGDDYITKPFSPKEVAYRVKAHLRRAAFVPEANTEVIRAGTFELDETRSELKKSGIIIELKPKELRLMTLFMKNKNQIISKETLYTRVWGEDFFGFDNTIMVHIRRLREKIEEQPSQPSHILTVKGLGYKFVVKDDGK